MELKKEDKQPLFFEWISRIIRFCLYGLAFSIPLGNAPVEIFSNLAIGLLLIELLIRSLSGKLSPTSSVRSFFRNPVFSAIIIYIAWNFLAMFFSIDVWQSMDAFYKKLLEGILLFFACFYHLKTKRHISIFVSILFLGTFLTGINGVFQWVFGEDFIRGSALRLGPAGNRVSASFGHANGLAGYLAALIPVLCSLLFIGGGRLFFSGGSRWKIFLSYVSCHSKIFIGILSILSSVVLGLTFSRGAWLGLIFGLVFLVFQKRRALIGVTAFMFLFLLVFVPNLNRHRPETIESFQQEFHKAGVRSLFSFTLLEKLGSGRNQFWRDAFYMAMEHPFLGSGLNTYTEFLNKHVETTKGFYAHNCYLQMAVEIGFTGAAVFIVILMLFFYVFLRNFLIIKDPLLLSLALGMAAGVLAFCIHSIFDTIMYSVQLGSLHWVLMGIVLAIFKISAKRQGSAEGMDCCQITR